MKKQVLFVLVLIAMLLVATGSAAAKATRTKFTGTYYNCGATDAGEVWGTGGVWETEDGTVLPRVLHVRGEQGFGYATSANDYYKATNEGLVNYDLNTITGSGGYQGTFEKTVNPLADGWVGGWQGTFGGYFKDGEAYLNLVGHGTGELAGMKYFAKFVPIGNPGDDPCEEGDDGAAAANVFDVTGVILDMRGPKP